jgi:xanthine dehydrogenase accessory factor
MNPLAYISKQLDEGLQAVVARVIRQTGPAPRSTGAKCIISEAGDLLHGTVGGGSLEHRVIEKAREVLKTGRSAILPFRLTGREVEESDMLCGGMVDVYLEPIYPEDSKARDIFTKARELISSSREGTLFTLIADGTNHGEECRILTEESGSSWGTISRLMPEQVLKLRELARVRRPRAVELSENGPLVFIEPIEPEPVLYLFGAGHISTYVAPLAEMAGFRVVVIDDRADFANKERFPRADEILVAPYSTVWGEIPVTTNSFIAIITRGHSHDLEVLRSALQFEPAYIGMIGSKRKSKIIYDTLLLEGCPRERIEQVHSPIGIEIEAETPEEIAVSIVAELISVRAKKRNLDHY